MSSRINAARVGALLAALACLVVAGCASQVMKSYVGQPIESAIADYGPPVNSFALDDGRRAFQWRQVQTSVVPGQTRVEVRETRHGERYQATTTPGHMESHECFYTLYARSFDGRWIVNDFRQPTLLCE